MDQSRHVAIIGGASNVWNDWGALNDLVGGWTGAVMVLNDMVAHWQHRLDYAATLHPELMCVADDDHPKGWSWLRLRRENGHTGDFTIAARRHPDGYDGHVDVVDLWNGGSASLAGVGAAYHYGYNRVVLCGCPLSPIGVFAETETTHDIDEALEGYRRGWERRLARDHQPPGRYLRDSVRSLSGWTRDLVGGVTLEWLEARRAA